MSIDQKNKIIIISSPSGAGKTTLCKLLLKKISSINLSISYTSRNQRLNEINGKDYFFVSKEKFKQLKNKNFFIETAINFGNHYGSPYKNLKIFKKNQQGPCQFQWLDCSLHITPLASLFVKRNATKY
jgi:guanylate kinase